MRVIIGWVLAALVVGLSLGAPAALAESAAAGNTSSLEFRLEPQPIGGGYCSSPSDLLEQLLCRVL